MTEHEGFFLLLRRLKGLRKVASTQGDSQSVMWQQSLRSTTAPLPEHACIAPIPSSWDFLAAAPVNVRTDEERRLEITTGGCNAPCEHHK